MPGAGRLNRRITFERLTDGTADETGGRIKSWVPFIVLWAHRRDVSDGEKAEAGAVSAHRLTRWVIRSFEASRTITPADRLRHGSDTYEIKGIKETSEGHRRFLEISTAIQLA